MKFDTSGVVRGGGERYGRAEWAEKLIFSMKNFDSLCSTNFKLLEANKRKFSTLITPGRGGGAESFLRS